jgi:hypothetical protein
MKFKLLIFIFLIILVSCTKTGLQAKIGSELMFDNTDIISVCNSTRCKGLHPSYGCQEVSNQYVCKYRFTHRINNKSAQKIVAVTSKLDIINGSGGQNYYSKNIDFYYDGKLINSLLLGEGINAYIFEDIPIDIEGKGVNQTLALEDGKRKMEELISFLK